MSELFTTIIWRRFAGVVGLLAVLFVCAPNAQAQTDAYSLQIAVADRSAGEQKNAFEVGMRSVLLANSGDKTVLNRNDVRAGLRAAETYVESFRYIVPEADTVISRDTPLTDFVRKSGKATQLMMVHFNRELIQELIRSSASPKTEDTDEAIDPFANVSTALMWLIVEDGAREILISASAGQNVMERAREIAGGAGISLSFPAGNDKDVEALSSEDLKTNNADALAAIASRYAQSVTLAAHITRSMTGSWEATWIKSAVGVQENKVTSSASLDLALQEGIAWLKPQAFSAGAGRSSSAASSSSNITSAEGLIWISPIRGTANYAEVIAWLSSLEGVDSVYPKEVLDNGMVFAVLPRSIVSSVSAAASNNQWLRAAAMPSSAKESPFAAGVVASFEYLR